MAIKAIMFAGHGSATTALLRSKNDKGVVIFEEKMEGE